MIKDNAMASTVAQAENFLYDINQEIESNGSDLQKVAVQNALNALETLYFLLREDQ
jgi:hypothetical protein